MDAIAMGWFSLFMKPADLTAFSLLRKNSIFYQLEWLLSVDGRIGVKELIQKKFESVARLKSDFHFRGWRPHINTVMLFSIKSHTKIQISEMTIAIFVPSEVVLFHVYFQRHKHNFHKCH